MTARRFQPSRLASQPGPPVLAVPVLGDGRRPGAGQVTSQARRCSWTSAADAWQRSRQRYRTLNHKPASESLRLPAVCRCIADFSPGAGCGALPCFRSGISAGDLPCLYVPAEH
jgi:hypothetical protein